jgi:predicted Fe-Mo cluster-binding NifX family protein
MIVAISIAAASLDAPLDTHFGRAAAFLLVNTSTGQRQIMVNPAVSTAGGAGVQAAEFVIRQGTEVVISGSFGPKAYEVLAAANISMYRASSGAIDDLLRQYQSDALERVKSPASTGRPRSHQ